MTAPKITLIGGPTALIEAGGFRLLTDPTFDAPGEYKLSYTTLTKTSGPALDADRIGPVDAVLLSHDQHADNFDRSGKACAMKAARLITTVAGAKRLGGPAIELSPWASTDLTRPDGKSLRITATPARHGPAGIEPLSGDVIGFVLTSGDEAARSTSLAIRLGSTASPRWRAAFASARCCCSRARRERAGHSTSP